MEVSRRYQGPVNAILCGLLCFMVIWIALYSVSHSQESSPPVHVECTTGRLPGRYVDQQSWEIQADERRGGSASCETRDGHYEDDMDYSISDYAWSQMKWIGQPAACRVRGQLIERLDAITNFRRGFALQFSGNVEDRTHILPWLLGTKVDLNRRTRRVFLDLGSNTFASSIQWFIQMYPCDFTEIHAFEIETDLLKIPDPFDEKGNMAAENTAARRTKQKPGIPGWMLDRIKVYNKLVSDNDDLESGKVNITRFIKHELGLSAEDTVVVKMDIEESEWPILTRWLNDPEMVRIVDEIFVEVHYKHSTMFNYHWNKFKHDRDEAKRLLADLRWKGFYVHFWP